MENILREICFTNSLEVFHSLYIVYYYFYFFHFQMRHLFTRKYIHVSTTQTSNTESNNMAVSMQHEVFTTFKYYSVFYAILHNLVFYAVLHSSGFCDF